MFILFIIAAMMLASRAWSAHPATLTCALFWVIEFYWFSYMLFDKAVVGSWFMLVGISSNAAVTLLNGGHMPVSTRLLAEYDPTSIWVPITANSKLFLLADILPLGFSIGDIFILAGALLLIYTKANRTRIYTRVTRAGMVE